MKVTIQSLGVLAVLVLACAGCKNKESLVPGTWTSTNMTVKVQPDKTFTGSMGPLAVAGTWKMDGDDVVLSPSTFQGKPIAELKAAYQKNMSKVPAQARAFFEDIDKPNVMKLADDGKSMTTDKAKDTNSGPPLTLTKSQ